MHVGLVQAERLHCVVSVNITYSSLIELLLLSAHVSVRSKYNIVQKEYIIVTRG